MKYTKEIIEEANQLATDLQSSTHREIERVINRTFAKSKRTEIICEIITAEYDYDMISKVRIKYSNE